MKILSPQREVSRLYVLNGNSESIIKLFRPFGLGEQESKVYFTLQVCGRTKVGLLWKKAGVPQSKIYYLLDSLETKGLVEVTKRFPKEVRAKPFLRFANEFLSDRKSLLVEIDVMIKEQKTVLRENKFVQVLG